MGLPQRWELQRHGYDQFRHIIREVNCTKCIGRRDADITCQTVSVSRQHCQIEYKDSIFYLTDLESLNGTYLNGRKINPKQPRELRDGDTIGLGVGTEEEGEKAEGEYYLFTFRKVTSEMKKSQPKPTTSNAGPAFVDLTLEDEDSDPTPVRRDRQNESSKEQTTRELTKEPKNASSASTPRGAESNQRSSSSDESAHPPPASPPPAVTIRQIEREQVQTSAARERLPCKENCPPSKTKTVTVAEVQTKKNISKTNQASVPSKPKSKSQEPSTAKGSKAPKLPKVMVLVGTSSEDEEEKEVKLEQNQRIRDEEYSNSGDSSSSSKSSSSEGEDPLLSSPTKYPRRKLKEAKKKEKATEKRLRELAEERERKKNLELEKAKHERKRVVVPKEDDRRKQQDSESDDNSESGDFKDTTLTESQKKRNSDAAGKKQQSKNRNKAPPNQTRQYQPASESENGSEASEDEVQRNIRKAAAKQAVMEQNFLRKHKPLKGKGDQEAAGTGEDDNVNDAKKDTRQKPRATSSSATQDHSGKVLKKTKKLFQGSENESDRDRNRKKKKVLKKKKTSLDSDDEEEDKNRKKVKKDKDARRRPEREERQNQNQTVNKIRVEVVDDSDGSSMSDEQQHEGQASTPEFQPVVQLERLSDELLRQGSPIKLKPSQISPEARQSPKGRPEPEVRPKKRIREVDESDEGSESARKKKTTGKEKEARQVQSSSSGPQRVHHPPFPPQGGPPRVPSPKRPQPSTSRVLKPTATVAGPADEQQPSTSTSARSAVGVNTSQMSEEARLKLVMAKVHKKQTAPSATKILNVAHNMPPGRRGPNTTTTFKEWTSATLNLPNESAQPPPVASRLLPAASNFRAPTPVLPGPQMTKKEKLALIAAREKKALAVEAKKPTAPLVAKITPRNRQDKLLEAFGGEEAAANTPANTLVVPPMPQQNPPDPDPPSSSDDDNQDNAFTAGDGLSADLESPPSSPSPPIITIIAPTADATARKGGSRNGRVRPFATSAQTKSVPSVGPLNDILKGMDRTQNKRPTAMIPVVPEVQVKSQPITIRGDQRSNPVVSSSSKPNSGMKKNEDRVYRHILQYWKPSWLKNNNGGKSSPPVHGNMELITNLPHYKGDFTTYFETFYPLMLHELWATIVQEYQKDTRRNMYHINRGLGMCEFQVDIEKIEEVLHCPLFPVDPNSKQAYFVEPFWHVVHLHTTAEKRGSFNKDLDFGKFSYDIKTANGIERREVFFFVRQGSESYDVIENNNRKFKYTLQIVTHLSQKGAIMLGNACKLEKVAYIHPKLREFAGISIFSECTLSNLILNPQFPDHDVVYDPNKIIPASWLVRAAYEMNPVQRGIMYHIATRILHVPGPDIHLLHGPPGTGKTQTIAALVRQLLTNRQNKFRVLICTPSNTALDELIRRLANSGLNLVRIGQTCSEDVKMYSLEEQAKDNCSKSIHSELISEAISGVNNQIDNLQKEVEDHGAEWEYTVLERKTAEINELKQKRQQHNADLDKLTRSKKHLEFARRKILHDAHVVFSTLNSCHSHIRKDLLALVKKGEAFFKCCIIDEATQATEIESLAPVVSLHCDKLVLVGDPKQLPATVLSSEADRRLLGQSLFTRLYTFFESRKNDHQKSPVMMLTTQYRMHPDILRWPNQRFYENKLETHPSVTTSQNRKLLLRSFVFLNIKGQEINESRQISNIKEVALVKEILTILQKLQGLSKNHVGLKIGIISPYNEQKTKLRELLQQIKKETSSSFVDTVEIDTVDSFQGREKDIILLSCVRTDDIGFLKTGERLNVALTRAKMSLIIIGDAECLNKNDMWRSLMDAAVNVGAFSHIPPDYRDRGERYLSTQLEQRLLIPRTASPSKR